MKRVKGKQPEADDGKMIQELRKVLKSKPGVKYGMIHDEIYITMLRGDYFHLC